MRARSYSTQFHRDIKRPRKRGKDFEKLKKLIELLLAEAPLPPQYKDHPLKSNWSGFRDAHSRTGLDLSTNKKEVHFERTGTHEELFED